MHNKKRLAGSGEIDTIGVVKLSTHVWRAVLPAAALGAAVFLPAAAGEDPFADVAPRPASAAPSRAHDGADERIWRREVYLLFGAGGSGSDSIDESLARVSAGFEAQQRFSSPTRTFASADYQGRVVYRRRPRDLLADPMGADEPDLSYETHNAYADLYNVVGSPGVVNVRLGHFYQPFGLNQQTDTHGTLLQLSNARVLGSERDWQAGLYGGLTRDLDYSLAYLAGAGHDWDFRGQAGLGAARLALSRAWLNEAGIEGGISAAAGERFDAQAHRRALPDAAHDADGAAGAVVATWRSGADLRKRFATAAGPVSFAAEGAFGEDDGDDVLSGLAQADWLHPRRRWGAAVQYTDYRRRHEDGDPESADARAGAVLTHYLRNDFANASLHWVALGAERRIRLTGGEEDTTVLLQYYRYW
jgi:hypothetical protein